MAGGSLQPISGRAGERRFDVERRPRMEDLALGRVWMMDGRWEMETAGCNGLDAAFMRR